MKEELKDIDILQQDNHNFNKGTEAGEKLMKKSFEQFGAGRSVLVDKDNRIIAGNKSAKAAASTGITKVRIIETDGTELIAVKRTDVSLDSKEGRQMALADNATTQVNLSWDEAQLQAMDEQFGLSVPEFDFAYLVNNSVNEEKKSEKTRKKLQWRKGKDYKEPLCNMNEDIQIHERKYYSFISSYKRSDEGIPISELKVQSNIDTFSNQAIKIIKGIIQLNDRVGWCIITTPKRRNKITNFATMVSQVISNTLGIPFYEDAVLAKNRHRINPEFTLNKDIKEQNIILYDDILTTGMTIKTTIDLLSSKNVMVIVGINNN